MTELRWQSSGPTTGHIFAGERALAQYDHGAERNHPYFSVVRPLNHDGVLTNTAPWDHRWHHGLWWSWKFINDVLFWEDHKEFGGARNGLGRAWVTDHRVDVAGGDVLITEQLEWRVDVDNTTLLSETRTMRAHADESLDGAWAIDWDLEWTTLENVVLSATPYPQQWWGGYGGLNYRAARSLEAGEAILASGGLAGRESAHARAVEWASFSGNVDGSGQDDPEHPAYGGIAMLGHPSNRGHPAPLYVFSAADEFGFLASAPLMHGSWTLAAGEKLRLRYRTLIFGSAIDASSFDGLHEMYAGTP